MSTESSDSACPILAPPPLPLLITGVAGVAGYNAFHYFREKYPGQVIAARRENNWRLQGEGITACDAGDLAGMSRLFDRHQFASVLNCEGSCHLKGCELDPQMAQRINVDSGRTLLQAVAGADVRLLHLSIDLVFSGVGKGGYTEQAIPDPVTVYGKTMAEAETVFLQQRSDACILRISLPMGVSFNGHAGAIDWIQARFMKSKPATLYYDEIRTPTYTDCLNRLFHHLLNTDHHGLFHAGGPRRLSLYQIAQVVNRVGGYDPRHLQGCYRIEAGPIPPRAGNVAMDSRKLEDALGWTPFDPWPYDSQWVPNHRDWHRERPAEELGSPELLAEILYKNPSSKFPAEDARAL